MSFFLPPPPFFSFADAFFGFFFLPLVEPIDQFTLRL